MIAFLYENHQQWQNGFLDYYIHRSTLLQYSRSTEIPDIISLTNLVGKLKVLTILYTLISFVCDFFDINLSTTTEFLLDLRTLISHN